MTPLKLFFVRHGESAGNIDKRKHLELADHAIPLTEAGRQQAYASRELLGQYFLDNNTDNIKTRSWVSPYATTRQTADEVIRGIETVASKSDDSYRYRFDFDRREHINLVEQQFGLFDGIPEDKTGVRVDFSKRTFRKITLTPVSFTDPCFFF